MKTPVFLNLDGAGGEHVFLRNDFKTLLGTLNQRRNID